MRGKAGLFSRFQPFSPSSVSGLTGWWDASDPGTLFDAVSGGSLVAADGGIARWEDKSAAGRHWTQSSSSLRPARKTAVKNGLDVVRFDGTDDGMVSSWLMEDIIASDAHTVFAVAVATSCGTNFSSPNQALNVAIVPDDPTNAATSFFYLRSSNLVGTFGFNGSYASDEQSYTIGDWKAFSSRHASSSLTVYVNGTGSGSPASIASFSLLGVTARLATGYGGSFNGDLAELITYNVALSAGDREAVESYLMDKWAIT